MHDTSDDTKLQIMISKLISFYLHGFQNIVCVFNYLHTINLSDNRLSMLPEEFGNLITLKECNLSYNELDLLPTNFENLHSLEILYLNNNKLTVLPYSIYRMGCLKELDLYENDISAFKYFPRNLDALDVAQNYADEPDDDLYLERKERLRLKLGLHRLDDAKMNDDRSVTEYYASENEEQEYNYNLDSQEEDWESDDYWDPSCRDPVWPDGPTIWNNFVAQEYKKYGYADLSYIQNTSCYQDVIVLPPNPEQFEDA